MDAARSESFGLLRAISRWQLVGLAVNDVVGSGVYLLPAAAAALLGPASVWAVLLAGFAVTLLVLCFAEAASYFDQPGGAYLYTREAFGSLIGFEVGWMTWLARVASIASLSNGLAQAMAYFWPGAAIGWARAAVIAAPVLALAWINVRGVQAGARAAVVLVITKMLPLLFFVGAGAWFIDTARFSGAVVPGGHALGQAALLLLFAYAGFENTPAAAGEYKNPRRDVPFALLAMILIVTLVYSGVQVVAATLRACARPFDVFGRWGGEEFIGIIRHIDPDGLKGMAERVRRLVEVSTISLGRGVERVTVSVGATLFRPEDDLAGVVRRADQLMYRSKEAGRNCVTNDL